MPKYRATSASKQSRFLTTTQQRLWRIKTKKIKVRIIERVRQDKKSNYEIIIANCKGVHLGGIFPDG